MDKESDSCTPYLCRRLHSTISSPTAAKVRSFFAASARMEPRSCTPPVTTKLKIVPGRSHAQCIHKTQRSLSKHDIMRRKQGSNRKASAAGRLSRRCTALTWGPTSTSVSLLQLYTCIQSNSAISFQRLHQCLMANSREYKEQHKPRGADCRRLRSHLPSLANTDHYISFFAPSADCKRYILSNIAKRPKGLEERSGHCKAPAFSAHKQQV